MALSMVTRLQAG